MLHCVSTPRKTSRSEREEQLFTTTFRIRPDQYAELRRKALNLTLKRGSGRSDASEALRAVLDQWMVRKR